jgi:hypothetical protein
MVCFGAAGCTVRYFKFQVSTRQLSFMDVKLICTYARTQ